MKKSFIAALFLVVLQGAPTFAATQSKPAAAAQTNAVPAFTQHEIPKSVFIIPASAKEGRNPFFPQSSQALPQPVKPRENPLDSSLFVLNGITPSGPKRTAMINGRTFEAGESGEVRLPSGLKVLIKCDEIRNDSAVITVDGQRRELRMRFGL